MEEASQQSGILKAVIDRIIPADDFPAASAAGVGDYINRQLNGDLHEQAASIHAGLRSLDHEATHRFGQHVPDLSHSQLDALLATVETGAVCTSWATDPVVFFTRLVNLTNEGYFGDPGNGGNRDAISWRMIGFIPFPHRQPHTSPTQEGQ